MLAENYYRKSLSLDDEYARAYLGLADVYYLKALESNINYENLYYSIQMYNRAIEAKNQPEHADISTKVHFGLGQCYLLLALTDEDSTIGLALWEFEAVLSEYNEGENT